ncbi:NADPH oxidase 4-like [Hydractinia symbiolongicarpus]|uniref:NADPH oxidase 4-like n=1 Tax=Hydractinia symbiolongicarpus TaxID=13093 RepID=UPI00254B073D|nr:NADPH oxidase 4-like [Hydractinia symbiolongicarpus]
MVKSDASNSYAGLKTPRKAYIKTVCQNEFIKILLVISWLTINIFLYIWSFLTYRNDDKFYYMYLMCNDFIFVSRACALVINFNCAIVLLPMNRFINSCIRTQLLKHTKRTVRRIIDHVKTLHILSAFSISIASVIHTIFHLVNIFYFRKNFSKVVKSINIADSKEDTTLWNFLLTMPGWTGALMLLILALIVMTSLKAVQAERNEVFKRVHHLSFIFLILSMFHGFGNVTKYLVNMDMHPMECHNTKDIANLPQCKEEPKFQHVTPSTWKWMYGPLIIHLIDRTIRFIRSFKISDLVQVKIHYGNVMELVFVKEGFQARPGQYILLQCPEIAEFEWHPFTLTKCPSGSEEVEKRFSVHVKVSGDWTGNLFNLITSMYSLKRVGSTCILLINDITAPTFRVDGPYGSPNQDGFHHRVNVSIATGIGITPFAAKLNFLRHFNPNKVHKNFKLEKLHLIWVCKDVNEFSWVVDLIKEVRKHLIEIEREDILTVQLFVTQKYKVNIESQVQMLENTFPQCEGCVTEEWFEDNMRQGRPDFKDELTKIAMQYEREIIGLFYCGGQELGRIISDISLKVNQRGNTFIFRREKF